MFPVLTIAASSKETKREVWTRSSGFLWSQLKIPFNHHRSPHLINLLSNTIKQTFSVCPLYTICYLKPIFHQNAKYLASGTFASPNAKDSTFASPNARNTNMLVSLALGDASFFRWPCTFHFFVYISSRWVANANPISRGI